MLTYRNLRFSDQFLRALIERRVSAAERASIYRALAMLDENERHHGLRLHQLRGKSAGKWSVSASDSIRITFTRAPDGIKELEDCTRHYDD